MLKRYLMAAVFLAGLPFLAGCEPEALVKQKVPKPVQNVLNFSGPSPEEQAKNLTPAVLKIQSPKNKEFYSASSPISFSAKALLPGGKPAAPNLVTWTATKAKSKGQIKIGAGNKLSKKLKLGDYALEAHLKVAGQQDKIAKLQFRVVETIDGSVTYKKKGLKGVELSIVDPERNTMVTTVKSDDKGNFAIEVPKEGSYSLTPSLKGYSFNPPFTQVDIKSIGKKKNFRASKGRIENIFLAESPDSDKPLEKVCPLEKVYLKASITPEGDAKPARLVINMVPQKLKNPKDVIVLGEFLDPAKIPDTTNPEAPKSAPVEVNQRAAVVQGTQAYKLVVEVEDNKGNIFAALAPLLVKIDPTYCLDRGIAEAISFQEKGELQEAIEKFSEIERLLGLMGLKRNAAHAIKTTFDKGLAHMQIAIKSDQDAAMVTRHLNKTLVALNLTVELDQGDAEAYLFRGMAQLLRNNPFAAIEQFSRAISLSPGLAEAYALRSLAYLGSEEAGGLSRAVDDMTQAMTLNPKFQVLRKTRSAALKMDIAHADDPRDSKTPTKEIPRPKAQDLVDVGKFIRK